MGKIVTTHLTVDAPVEDVWETLTDLAGYRRWNPFITAAAGTISVGEQLALTIQAPGGRATTTRPWVTAVEEHHYVEWLGRLALPGLLDARHSFTLTPMARGRTLVQQSETFTGVLVPSAGSRIARTRAGFVAMNEALARTTARPPAPDPVVTRSSDSASPGTATSLGCRSRSGDPGDMNQSQYDVVIIGGGAAGLSAALVLARARRKVLVVDAGAPRNAPAAHMHGYLSRDGLPPAQLLACGREEVSRYDGEIIEGSVSELAPDGRTGFRALLAGGRRVSARQVLVTTGLRDELPDVPGLQERWARDVLHCPYCHGHEVRDHQLGVIGGSPGAVRYAQIVRQWTHDLVYFTPPGTLTDAERSQLVARAIRIIEGTIEQLIIDGDQLRGVQMADGCVVPRDALFVPPRFLPSSDLLIGVGCDVDVDGWVTTDTTGRTSVPGVWAAGNVVDPRAQVITAAGAGSAAAIALNADLVDDDVSHAVRDVDRGLRPGTSSRS